MRARGAVGGQQPGLRLHLVRGTRRSPACPTTSCPRGSRHGTRIDGDSSSISLPRVGVVGRDHHLVELQAGEARQQPAAQRPRRIVLAADSVSVAPAPWLASPRGLAAGLGAGGLGGDAGPCARLLACDTQAVRVCDTLRARPVPRRTMLGRTLARKFDASGHADVRVGAMLYTAFEQQAARCGRCARGPRAPCRCSATAIGTRFATPAGGGAAR